MALATGMTKQMQALHTNRSTRSYSSHSRYSSKSMAKPVNFFCLAPEAKAVGNWMLLTALEQLEKLAKLLSLEAIITQSERGR